MMIRDKIPFVVYCKKTEKCIEKHFPTTVETDIIETARCILVKLIKKWQINDIIAQLIVLPYCNFDFVMIKNDCGSGCEKYVENCKFL